MPERTRRNERGELVLRSPLPQRWWHYAEKRPALYHAIGRGHAFARHPEGWDPSFKALETVLVCAEVTKHLGFEPFANRAIFSDRVDVFATSDEAVFAVLQSSVHEVWARKQSSRLETRLKYSPGNAFETFPLPTEMDGLREPGRDFKRSRDSARRQLGLSLTAYYNQLHDPDEQREVFAQSRRRQRTIDSAVCSAYGWTDLDLSHGFHAVPYLPENDRIRFTISEPARLEVLRRLSRLNRERWQAEQDAAAAPATYGEPARPRLLLVSEPNQGDLFGASASGDDAAADAG